MSSKGTSLAPIFDEEGAIGLSKAIGCKAPVPPDPAVDRDDVVQEAVIAGLLAYRRFRPGEGTTAAGYVFRYARWATYRVMEKQDTRGRKVAERKIAMRERPVRFSEIGSTPFWEPIDPLSLSTISTAITKAILATLGPEDSRIAWLFLVEGHERDSVARLLGLPLTTVKHRVTRVKRRLATLFGEA